MQSNPYALTGDYGFPVTKVIKPQEASMVEPPMPLPLINQTDKT